MHTNGYIIQAFKEERSYPGYVWITPGWYQQGWWKADKDYLHSLNCKSSEIEKQLERSLVLLAHPNTVKVYYWSSLYCTSIIVLQSFLNITEPYNSSSYAMDAVMTLALALNKTLEDPFSNVSLQTATEAVKFTGASVS